MVEELIKKTHKTFLFQGIIVDYIIGRLANVSFKDVTDIITWEAIRHDIPFYEDQLDKTKWKCLQ